MPQKTNFPQRARRENFQDGHMIVQQNLEQLRDAWDNIGVQVPGSKNPGDTPVWDAVTQTWLPSSSKFGTKPPGTILAELTANANVNVVGTTSAGATTILGPTASFNTDGVGSVIVEFIAYAWQRGTVQILLEFWLDTTAQGVVGFNSVASGLPSCYVQAKLTPLNGNHTVTCKGYVDAGTGIVYAGNGGAGVGIPMLLRVSKA